MQTPKTNTVYPLSTSEEKSLPLSESYSRMDAKPQAWEKIEDTVVIREGILDAAVYTPKAELVTIDSIITLSDECTNHQEISLKMNGIENNTMSFISTLSICELRKSSNILPNTNASIATIPLETMLAIRYPLMPSGNTISRRTLVKTKNRAWNMLNTEYSLLWSQTLR